MQLLSAGGIPDQHAQNAHKRRKIMEPNLPDYPLAAACPPAAPRPGDSGAAADRYDLELYKASSSRLKSWFSCCSSASLPRAAFNVGRAWRSVLRSSGLLQRE
jgi:hypothetical protein